MPLSRRTLIRNFGILSLGQFMTVGCSGSLTKLKSLFAPKPTAQNTVQVFLEGPWLLSCVPDPDPQKPSGSKLLAATTIGQVADCATHTCSVGIFDPKNPNTLASLKLVGIGDNTWAFDRSDNKVGGNFQTVIDAISASGDKGNSGIIIDTGGKGSILAKIGRQILLPMPDTVTPIAQQLGVSIKDQNGKALETRPYCVVALGYSGTDLKITPRNGCQGTEAVDNLVFRMQYKIGGTPNTEQIEQHFQAVQTALSQLIQGAPATTSIPTSLSLTSEKWHWPHPTGSYNPPLAELGLNGCDDDSVQGGCVYTKAFGSADCLYGGAAVS